MRRLHVRKLLEYSFGLVFIILVLYLGGKIGFGSMIDFMKANLLIGLLIYFIYSVVSNVIIFLPLVPLWPIMVYVYGFNITIIITVTGTLIGASISFFLAKKFGKSLVQKMMGKHLFYEVEHTSKFKSIKKFMLIRILGNNYYDIISYMAGLSRLTFKSYFVVTTIATIIWTFALFYLIEITGGIKNMTSFLDLMAAYGVLVLIGTLGWEIYHKKHTKK